MKARLDFRHASPEGMNAMSGLHAFVHDCGLDQALLELIKLRASQINGCGHCIDMHAKELGKFDPSYLQLRIPLPESHPH
jgi:AhpD family alkylhydroperoxidase